MNSTDRPVYITLLHKTTDKYQEELSKELNFKLCGYGGSLMHDIEGVNQDFNVVLKPDLAEARRLMVYCIEKLQTAINEDKKLRPYLREYPFSKNRIELSIGFINSRSCYEPDSSVDYAFALNGRIFYSKWSTITNHFERVHEETYEEALKIVSKSYKEIKP